MPFISVVGAFAVACEYFHGILLFSLKTMLWTVNEMRVTARGRSTWSGQICLGQIGQSHQSKICEETGESVCVERE